MSEIPIAIARQAVISALEALDAVSGSIGGQDLIDQLPFLNLGPMRRGVLLLRCGRVWRRNWPTGRGRIGPMSWPSSPTFDAVARAIQATITPNDPDDLRGKSLGERQADALAAICEHALNDGYLPAEGGERPHFTAILKLETLQKQARGVALEFGGTTTAGAKSTTSFTGPTAAQPTSTTSSCSASPATTNSTTPAGEPEYATADQNSLHQNGTTHTRDHEEIPGQSH